MSRQFSPIELNHLRKFGYANLDLSSIGEKPVEYVTGHATFRDLDFLVTSDTLIPRIESEKIIDLAYDYLVNQDKAIIADVGSGSGCLGITLIKTLLEKSYENFEIYFSDISPTALKLSQGNSLRLIPGHQKKFHFLISNLLESFPPIKFNLIIANLPYIPSQSIAGLDSSVKDYEPITALDGGHDGTQIINLFLQQVKDYLMDDFLIILEIDSSHSLSMFTIPDGTNAKILKDIFNRNRFLLIGPKY